MNHINNPWKGTGLPRDAGLQPGDVVTDPGPARALFAACPAAAATPLTDAPDLAAACTVARVHLKDERGRLGLGSFKALGAAFAIAKRAAAAVAAGTASDHETALQGETFVCASAGNHGLSMAAGARVFGARAVVYLAETVPEAFAERLRDKGADVVREGAIYEDSMAGAMAAADTNGWTLLSDSSWIGYADPARDVMEGYLIMTAEVAEQIPAPPTHVFLQAGVGGLAAGCCAAVRTLWGTDPTVIVVEPENAPALFESIKAGRPVEAPGPVSAMGRLDCKVPSHLALAYLAREADVFMTVSEDEAQATVDWLGANGMATTPSGAGGIAGLQCGGGDLGLTAESRVLAYISEGPEA